MGDLVERLQNRIAWEFCSFGPNRPDEIGANGGPNWRRYLPKAEQVTSEVKARIEALEAREKALVEQHAAIMRVISNNLGEYIDKRGSVDVTIALAFEATRAAAALGSEQ